ncbi:hypothetical protein Tco_1181740 [Tanacetum coccineum]
MADVNVNAPAEQAPAMAPPTQKSQSNPIYKIAVDVLKHTNFFRAFTASSIIPSIYIQQFWDTVRYVKNTRSYSCQLDEQWFDLTKDTLRDALQITPVDNNNPFSSPPTPDALINFVNELGYPKVVRTLSTVVTNDMLQPWRALTTIINLCLTGKTSTFERPRAPGKKRANPLVIPSVRFTKLIIHHLQSKHKFYPRPYSPLHLPYEEYVLGYLKFSTKGTKREVFGMPIPNDLITDDIRGEQYYNEYLEKVAKHQRYLAVEEVSNPDSPAPKPAKATKPKATKKSKPQLPKPTPVTTEPSKKDQSKKRVPDKEQVYGDEEADTQREIEESLKEVHDAHRGPLPPVVIWELDSGKFQPLPDVQGKGKEKVSHDESSSLYAELGLTDNEIESDVEVPGTDAGDQDEGQAGPNPEFTTTAYPNVQENLKLPTEDQVRLEEPISSAGTLSSLQNLDKELSFADQFLVEK